MSIIIYNQGPLLNEPEDGWHQYAVYTNQELIVGFSHKRSDGLGACLQAAAEAVFHAELGNEPKAAPVETEQGGDDDQERLEMRAVQIDLPNGMNPLSLIEAISAGMRDAGIEAPEEFAEQVAAQVYLARIESALKRYGFRSVISSLLATHWALAYQDITQDEINQRVDAMFASGEAYNESIGAAITAVVPNHMQNDVVRLLIKYEDAEPTDHEIVEDLIRGIWTQGEPRDEE